MQPTFIERDDISFVGLTDRVTADKPSDGPGLWQRFRPQVARIPKRRGDHALGVIEVVDKAKQVFAYSTAVEVEAIGDVPEGLVAKTLAGGRFAVFTLRLESPDIGGHIRKGFQDIYGTWLPQSGERLCAYYDLEYYDARFDPETMLAEVDLYVPVW